MAKPEWGIKRTCQSCGAHFYDLMKTPIVCPKCGTEYDPEAVLKSRRARSSRVADMKKVKPSDAEDAEFEEEEDGVEELDSDEDKAVVAHDIEDNSNDDDGDNALIVDIDDDDVADADDDALLDDDSDLAGDDDVVVIKKDDEDL